MDDPGQVFFKAVPRTRRTKSPFHTPATQLGSGAELGRVFHVSVTDGRPRELDLNEPNFLESVACIEDFTEYSFRDFSLLREALCATREPLGVGRRLVLQGNQRLAMLGDAALKLALLDEWMPRVETCGETDHRCQSLLPDHNLFKVGRMHGVDDMMTNADGKAFLLTGQDTAGKVAVASTVEAIIGAVYLDSGRDMEVVKRAIKAILSDDKFE